MALSRTDDSIWGFLSLEQLCAAQLSEGAAAAGSAQDGVYSNGNDREEQQISQGQMDSHVEGF